MTACGVASNPDSDQLEAQSNDSPGGGTVDTDKCILSYDCSNTLSRDDVWLPQRSPFYTFGSNACTLEDVMDNGWATDTSIYETDNECMAYAHKFPLCKLRASNVSACSCVERPSVGDYTCSFTYEKEVSQSGGNSLTCSQPSQVEDVIHGEKTYEAALADCNAYKLTFRPRY